MLRALAPLAAIGVLASVSSAYAEETVAIELNKLEDATDACTTYIVVKNDDSVAYDAFQLDLVFFAPDGVIRDRLLVEAGPLRAGKTVVKLFDIPGVACKDVGRVLVNDVTECTAGGSAVEGCVDKVALSSRAEAKLEK